MNSITKKLLTGLACFAAGAGVGYALGYVIESKKCDEKIDEAYEQATRDYNNARKVDLRRIKAEYAKRLLDHGITNDPVFGEIAKENEEYAKKHLPKESFEKMKSKGFFEKNVEKMVESQASKPPLDQFIRDHSPENGAGRTGHSGTQDPSSERIAPPILDDDMHPLLDENGEIIRAVGRWEGEKFMYNTIGTQEARLRNPEERRKHEEMLASGGVAPIEPLLPKIVHPYEYSGGMVNPPEGIDEDPDAYSEVEDLEEIAAEEMGPIPGEAGIDPMPEGSRFVPKVPGVPITVLPKDAVPDAPFLITEDQYTNSYRNLEKLFMRVYEEDHILVDPEENPFEPVLDPYEQVGNIDPVALFWQESDSDEYPAENCWVRNFELGRDIELELIHDSFHDWYRRTRGAEYKETRKV